MAPDVTTALFQYGPLGVMCAWLMWREIKQQERLEAREFKQQERLDKQEERREERHQETQKEIRLQRKSIDDLIHVITIDIYSRPEVASRVAQDAKAIADAVKARNAS